MASSEGYEYTIGFLCESLEVSKSGYYKWRKSRPKRQAKIQRDYELTRKIEEIHLGSKKVYGSPAIHGIIREIEPNVSVNKIARLMRANDIRSKTKKKFKVTTDSKHNLKIAPNHLMQDFTAQRPNQIWATDITYIPTKEGWMYLCTVLDVFSRKIVGWTLEDNMRAEMVKKALEIAYQARNPGDHLIVHSDRGVQYASNSFREFLASKKAIQSMSRKGNCWDNSIMETFFGRFKVEHMFWENYKTRIEARSKIFEWIEVNYNRKRVHSSLNYTNPTQFEEDKMVKVA
jgi:transposase InsO family protein